MLYKCIDERSSWDAKFDILKHTEALNEIFFWKYNLTKLNVKCIKPLFDPQEYLYSDASSFGLGAVTSGALQYHRHLLPTSKQNPRPGGSQLRSFML